MSVATVEISFRTFDRAMRPAAQLLPPRVSYHPRLEFRFPNKKSKTAQPFWNTYKKRQTPLKLSNYYSSRRQIMCGTLLFVKYHRQKARAEERQCKQKYCRTNGCLMESGIIICFGVDQFEAE